MLCVNHYHDDSARVYYALMVGDWPEEIVGNFHKVLGSDYACGCVDYYHSQVSAFSFRNGVFISSIRLEEM